MTRCWMAAGSPPLPYRPYAGIGSTVTPDDVLALMVEIGAAYGRRGWTLRSGGAPGADSAFEAGCDQVGGLKEIFLPAQGFNGRSAEDGGPGRVVHAGTDQAAMDLAKQYHPAWHRVGSRGRLNHARNGYQALGRDLASPVGLVICWTQGGSGRGGTGQAIRICRSRSIPVFDLAIPAVRDRFEKLISMPAVMP